MNSTAQTRTATEIERKELTGSLSVPKLLPVSAEGAISTAALDALDAGVFCREDTVPVFWPLLVGLRSPTASDSISPVTPTQRRGKCMSRRREQRGYIERKGNWWHLRYWSDISNGRPHKSQPICLAIGKEKKTKSEAERLGAEWLTAQGINTNEHLARVIGPTVTFREQSKIWLNWLQTRNKKPIPETSVPSIRSALDCWLLPTLGDLLLSEVDELALNGVVNKMLTKLSPKTIKTYTCMAKEVVESQRD